MSEHLPECHTSMIPDFHNERWICICAPLRACEQRILDAVREAIREIPTDDFCCMCPEDEGLTLAAIDALREKP